MIAQPEKLWARRSDLIVKPTSDSGRFVVKIPDTAEYFHVGIQENFLLHQLDGHKDRHTVCDAFQREFDTPLSNDDLDGFIEMALEKGLLETPELKKERVGSSEVRRRPKPKQSILYWRKKVYDPDRLFDLLEPKLRVFWTRGFLMISAISIVFAILTLWSYRQNVATSFANALRWESILFVWVTIVVVGLLHEFAHGLTCKHYGGEVREIGFLLIFFMPGFYCNISDAWLFPEKSKRLWVTLAGGYFELFLWAISVLVWRVTMLDTLINYLALIVVTVSGIRSLFNFNPLIKLDGYYLLSDSIEIPNLRQKSISYLKAKFRHLMWGASPAPPETSTRFLLGFGLMSWIYSVGFLGFMLFAFSRYAGRSFGPFGFAAISLVGLVVMRGLFQGISNGEVVQMIRHRLIRTFFWLAILGGAIWFFGFVDIDDRVGGTFTLRATKKFELRAPVDGFLREIYYDSGDDVSSSSPVVQMEIPNLDSLIAQKNAEIEESDAKLKLLQAGTSSAEKEAQRSRVANAKRLKDFAKKDLQRSKDILAADIERLEHQVVEHKVEVDAATDSLRRHQNLRDKNAATLEQVRESQRKQSVRLSIWKQSQAELLVRISAGIRKAEEALAIRDKELADLQSQLKLLEAKTRPEEIAAAQARRDHLKEERIYLELQKEQLSVFCSFPGLVTTWHLKEKSGQYLKKGDLICTIEDSACLMVEITLDEDDLEGVKVGQTVTLKTRSLPNESLNAVVAKISPVADERDTQSLVIITCQLKHFPKTLRSGMTGYARITRGHKPIGQIALNRMIRFLRTEFWW